MGKDDRPWTEIDKRIEGPTIEAGGLTLQPIGRIAGKLVNASNEHSGFCGLKATLSPQEVIVCQGDEDRTVPLASTDDSAVSGILAACGIVFAAYLVTRIIVGRISHSMRRPTALKSS